MRKHILYFVLIFCFVLGFAPATAHAEETESPEISFDISEGRIEIRDDDDANEGKIQIEVKGASGNNYRLMANIDPNTIITVTGTTLDNELHVLTNKPVTIKAKDLHIDTS